MYFPYRCSLPVYCKIAYVIIGPGSCCLSIEFEQSQFQVSVVSRDPSHSRDAPSLLMGLLCLSSLCTWLFRLALNSPWPEVQATHTLSDHMRLPGHTHTIRNQIYTQPKCAQTKQEEPDRNRLGTFVRKRHGQNRGGGQSPSSSVLANAKRVQPPPRSNPVRELVQPAGVVAHCAPRGQGRSRVHVHGLHGVPQGADGGRDVRELTHVQGGLGTPHHGAKHLGLHTDVRVVGGGERGSEKTGGGGCWGGWYWLGEREEVRVSGCKGKGKGSFCEGKRRSMAQGVCVCRGGGG